MKVAIAVIQDEAQRVLITQRSPQTTHAGMWEFPGGKLEPGETPPMALLREIKEEVGLDIIHYHFLGQFNHTYSNQSVSLLVYHVSAFEGHAYCREGQPGMRWVTLQQLQGIQFPEANEQIVGMIGELFLARTFVSDQLK